MVLSELNAAKVSLNRMNTGSRKLDDIICSQKAHIDKHGVGYVNGASTSNVKGTNCFVKKERRHTFCIGTHFAEIFKFTGLYA